MIEDYLHVLICPITKESLSIVNRNKLLESQKDIISEISDDDKFLINESQSYLYRFTENGYPDILPENAVALKIVKEQ